MSGTLHGVGISYITWLYDLVQGNRCCMLHVPRDFNLKAMPNLLACVPVLMVIVVIVSELWISGWGRATRINEVLFPHQ